MAFYGNPNRTITAIDAVEIVASRTSGQVPCFIQVSASAVTADGTSKPYEDLDYFFDFGDPDSTEIFDNPGTRGGRVNTNLQRGPEATHCYRQAGTYTITMHAYGVNGGEIVTDTATLEITVTAFNKTGGEYWANSNAVGSSNVGTEANPFTTIAAINTALATGDNKQLNVVAGSHFTGSVALRLIESATDYTGRRIVKVGTGANPIWEVTSGTNPAIEMRGVGNHSDVVLQNQKAIYSGADPGSGQRSCTIGLRCVSPPYNKAHQDVYLDNCSAECTTDARNMVVMLDWQDDLGGHAQPLRYGLWNCDIVSPATTVTNTQGFFGGAAEWFFMCGGSISGAGPGGFLSHHIYNQTRYHSCFRYIDFEEGVGRNFCIDLNWNSQSGDPEEARYHLISDCNITGTDRAFDAGESDVSTYETQFKDMVTQFNRIHHLRLDAVITFDSAHSMTMRDSYVYSNVYAETFFPGTANADQIEHFSASLYRNFVYIPASAVSTGGRYVVSWRAGASWPWAEAQQFTDNIIQDMRGAVSIGAQIVNVSFDDFPANGSLFDRTQIFTPNDAGNVFANTGTLVSDASWTSQGLGSITRADPNWPDPANGDFGGSIRTIAIEF